MKNRVAIAGDLQGAVDVLRGAYAGERGWLLTCGPSFKDQDLDVLQEQMKNDVVISVKQTLDLIQGRADFHLLNSWNIQPYDYSEHSPIVLMERGPHDPDVPNIDWDMCFPVTGVDPSIPRKTRLENRLAQKCNFDDYLFDVSLARPWGPGVVYELGIYLAAHLGLKELITVGWDIGERNTNKMEHFYDSKNPQVLSKAKGFFGKSKGGSAEESLYNQPGYYQAEVDVIAGSTKQCAEWLQSKGVLLKVVSDRSLVSATVPRLTLPKKKLGDRKVVGRPLRASGPSVLFSSAPSEGKDHFVHSLQSAMRLHKVHLIEMKPHPRLSVRPGPLLVHPGSDIQLFDTEIDQGEFGSAAAILSKLHGVSQLHACHGLKLYLDDCRMKLDKCRANAVVLWHQFTACHLVLAALAKSREIPVRYVEHGVLPGTVDWDSIGQMAERQFMLNPKAFATKSIDSSDRKCAQDYLRYVKREQLTRKTQPPAKHNLGSALKKGVSRKRQVFYAGQFDVHTGMVPRWSPRSHKHSPYFDSTLEALRYLDLSLDSDRYRLLFKPHPNGGDDLTSGWNGLSQLSRVINKANIFDCIVQSDVVVTILSQVAYLGCVLGKPVVLLGNMPLSGSGAVYEIRNVGEIPEVIDMACKRGVTRLMQRAWIDHVARLLKYESISTHDDVSPYVSRTLDSVVGELMASATGSVR